MQEKSTKEAYAVLLYAIIAKDGSVSIKEREKFDNFFQNEFSLNDNEVADLFDFATKEIDYKKYIDILKASLQDNPMQKLNFLQYLNQTVISDGIEDIEYEIFEEIRDALV